jgi:hypothetical protein
MADANTIRLFQSNMPAPAQGRIRTFFSRNCDKLILASGALIFACTLSPTATAQTKQSKISNQVTANTSSKPKPTVSEIDSLVAFSFLREADAYACTYLEIWRSGKPTHILKHWNYFDSVVKKFKLAFQHDPRTKGEIYTYLKVYGGMLDFYGERDLARACYNEARKYSEKD